MHGPVKHTDCIYWILLPYVHILYFCRIPWDGSNSVEILDLMCQWGRSLFTEIYWSNLTSKIPKVTAIQIYFSSSGLSNCLQSYAMPFWCKLPRCWCVHFLDNMLQNPKGYSTVYTKPFCSWAGSLHDGFISNIICALVWVVFIF